MMRSRADSGTVSQSTVTVSTPRGIGSHDIAMLGPENAAGASKASEGGKQEARRTQKAGVHASEDIILPLVVLDSPELGGKGPPGARGRELGGGRGERSGLAMPP